LGGSAKKEHLESKCKNVIYRRVRTMGVKRVSRVVLLLLWVPILLAGCTLMNAYPIAQFTWTFETDYTVSFDASQSSDPDGIIVSYHWNFGDGATATGETVQHTFSPGEYPVLLTVYDDKGKKASITYVIRAVKELEVPGPYWSIQTAIDAAEDGEVVIVSPGTYEENLNFRGKQITVRSEQPDNQVIVDATILVGKEYDRPVVTFSSGETRLAVLEGFTILGDLQRVGSYGSAIYVNTASPTIRKNVISNNAAAFAGGGIYLFESRALIVDNTISANQAPQGGGLAAAGLVDFPTIEGNYFVGNLAEAGAAIHLASTDPGKEPGHALATRISDNTFIGNAATGLAGGGAIYVMYDCQLALDSPDSNTYQNNTPNDVFYEVPP